MIALALLGLFAVSCEKPKVAEAPAASNAPTMSATVTWTPSGSSTPRTVTGDVKYGDVGARYVIQPKITGNVCASGTWSATIEGPANAVYSSSTHSGTGETVFIPVTKGTYKITLRYSCPGCADISITITITVS